MSQKQIRDTSAGFASPIYLFIIIIVIGLIGLCAWRIHQHKPKGSGGLAYKTTNFDLSLSVDADNNFDQQVTISVDFSDSVSSDPCPAEVQGFSGQADISYNGPSADLLLTQNIKPPKPTRGGVTGSACPQDIVPDYIKRVRFDRKWLIDSKSHAITANNQNYTLTYNKQGYTLSLSKPGTRTQTVLYPPDKVVFLFSHASSPYGTCMSESQLLDYAKQNNLALVSDKYLGFESAFNRLHPNIKSDKYYSPLLLVVANDGLKVVQAQQNKQADDQCHLWVDSQFTF